MEASSNLVPSGGRVPSRFGVAVDGDAVYVTQLFC